MCFCTFCAPVSTFVFLAYSLQVFLICILWGTRESEVVLCILLVLRKKTRTATCFFCYDVLSHLILLTSESLVFCKTLFEGVEHHWALFTAQNLPASFVVVQCWWNLVYRQSCILHMNICSYLDLIPNSHIFKIQICLYNRSSSQLLRYSIPGTPMFCSPYDALIRDVLGSISVVGVHLATHHPAQCQTMETWYCTNVAESSPLFSTHATFQVVLLRWHASQLYMQTGEVACHCILLHGSILHVSYFSWWQAQQFP